VPAAVPRVVLTEVPFEHPVVRDLFAEWDDELTVTTPGFRVHGGMAIEPTQFARPAGAFLLALIGEEPSGCGGLRQLDQLTGEVKRLFVRPAARGQGVGRVVLSGLEARGVELGLDRLRLDTAGNDPGAVALFRSAGFEEIPDYNGNRRAHHWFEKRLPAA
jgi:GNAT superfamily N-acetyltransferase